MQVGPPSVFVRGAIGLAFVYQKQLGLLSTSKVRFTPVFDVQFVLICIALCLLWLVRVDQGRLHDLIEFVG